MVLRILWCMYLFKLVFLFFFFFFFPRCIPRSGISGSYGSSIFRFLSNLHTIFHTDCSSLQSHQHCAGVLISPYSFQHLLHVFFLMIAILTGVRWYLIVILIYISLMIRDTLHFFHVSLAFYISSLEKCLFRSAYFLNRFVYFYFFPGHVEVPRLGLELEL